MRLNSIDVCGGRTQILVRVGRNVLPNYSNWSKRIGTSLSFNVKVIFVVRIISPIKVNSGL